MANPIPTKTVQSAKVSRRVRGELAGGQKFKGMITLPFTGSGEQLVENMYIDTGKYLKMTGNSVWKDLSLTVPVDNIFEYQTPSGEYQLLVTYYDGSNYKLKAIEEDGTVLTPNTVAPTITGTADFTEDSNTVTGTLTLFTTELKVGDWIKATAGDGIKYRVVKIKTDTSLEIAGLYEGTDAIGSAITYVAGVNPNFTKKAFYSRSIGGIAYIANGQFLYAWNGTDLLLFDVDTFGEIKGLLVDGRRLVVIGEIKTSFSINDPAQNVVFFGSSGVNSSGDYKTTLRAKGGIEAGAGIILFGDYGAESHWVRSNDASDDVSADTKIQEFRYTGRGVSEQNRVTAGRDYAYFLNELGLHRMNPFTGDTKNLMDDAGKILRYFHTLSLAESKLVFSPKEKAIVFSTTDGDGTNDRLLAFYEDTESFAFKTRVYANGLAVVDNQLYGGEQNGKIVKVWDDSRYSDQNGESYPARIITEWDSITSVHELKSYLRGNLHFSLSPDSDGLTVNLYFNGSDSVISSSSYTTEDATDTSSAVGEGGIYEFGVGSPDETNNSQNVRRKRWVNSFTTYAIELTEQSIEPLEFISLMDTTSNYGTENYNQIFADKLFDLST